MWEWRYSPLVKLRKGSCAAPPPYSGENLTPLLFVLTNASCAGKTNKIMLEAGRPRKVLRPDSLPREVIARTVVDTPSYKVKTAWTKTPLDPH
jgi:hypothetical protein